MYAKKYIGFLCFVAIIAIAGCGQKGVVTKTAAREEWNEKGITPIETVKNEPTMPENIEGASTSPAAPNAPAAPPLVSKEPVTGGSVRDVIIADFEGWPDSLGGEIGVFGSLEPDWEKANQQPVSWVYESASFGYFPKNVHSGKNSFRLVNGVGTKPEYTWGSFSMDLGPTTDLTVVPKKVESFDASGFKYLTFWVKGAKGGEKMEFLARDAHALNYSPQVKYKLPDATAEWKKIVLPLSEIGNKTDLTKLDNIGIAFGKDVGNVTGDTIYMDDFLFTNNP